jgi:signal transduction histidine kinase
MVIPLMADGEQFGALFLIRRHPRVFTEAEFPNVRILADMASLALHRTLTVERLRGTIEVRDRAIQARDEVLRVVSHDLRNPINNIQITVRALANPSIPEDKRRALFDILSRASERMNRLIDDLIAVARLREGQEIPLALRAENPSTIIHDACGQFVVQAESKSLRLLCDEQNILPTVKADRHRILQVLSNLIDNAIKFTPEGGAITLSCEPFERSVRFMVRDTGRGIEERFLDRIFDLFWQAKPTAHMGSGLGLAIAKSIVEQHGGRMWVESKPGLGTTFYFTLLQATGSVEEEKVG